MQTMVPRGSGDFNELKATVAELSGTVKTYMDLNTRQHEDIKSLVFADSPNSIQGQINVFNDRAFGDGPTSLKSQIAEIRGRDKWVTGYFAGTFAIFGALSALIALKWSVILEFFKAVSK